MKKIYTFFISIVLLSNANAQTTNWIQYGGGAGNDLISGMAKDADNNFYATGEIENSATFGNTNVTGGVFVTKYDSNGVQKMAVAYGDIHAAGKSICLDNAGNIYVLGKMDSTVMMGNTLLSQIGGFDIFLTKYNTEGNLLWAKQFGGNKDDKGIEIICDKSNQLFIAGYFSGEAEFGNISLQASSDSSDIFFAKCDTGGNILWIKTAGGINDDQSNSICADEKGNIFITGTFQLTATFDSLSVTSLGVEDFFIAKYDSSGNILWVQTAGDYDTDKGLGICADVAGNVYVTGIFKGTVTFGNFSLYACCNRDLFIASYSPSGNCRWVKQTTAGGLDHGADIAMDDEGNILMCGAFESTVNFDGIIFNSTGLKDMFVARYDSLGYVEAILKGGGYYDDAGYSVLSAGNDKIVLAGFFTTNATFGNYILNSYGLSDAVISEMNLASLTITSVSDSAFCPLEQFTVSYSAEGYFINGNVFTVQLSNSSGDFSYPTFCGSVNSTISGLVNSKAPYYPYNGSNYKLRIISSNPICAGWYPLPITLSTNPNVYVSGSSSVCTGDSALLIASGATSYTWVPSNELNSATNDSVYAAINYTTNFSITGYNQYGCWGSASKTLTLLSSSPVANISTSNPTTFCAGLSCYLIATYSQFNTYQWKLNGNNISGATSSAYYANQTGTFTCTVSNSCGTNSSNEINIVVNPLPVVTTSTYLPVCQYSTAFTLTGGSPIGGTYSGTNVSNNILTPSTAGTFSITYSYTDGNTCKNTVATNITVQSAPVVTFLPTKWTFCLNELPFTLNGGTPAGGTYSGTGVADGIFTPSSAGEGSFVLTYSYTNANGCSKSATKTFTVYALPTVAFTLADTTYCLNDPSFTLTGGTPAGGTYSGTGVSGGIFSPSLAGAGSFVLTYSYTNANGCSKSATKTFTVYELPTVAFTLADTTYCLNDPSFTLTGGTPAGGTYSGTGVSGGIFTPSSAGAGSFVLTYSYTNTSGCSKSATKTFTVYALPTVAFTLADTTFCLNDPSFTLTSGTPAGGTYSGTGVSGGIFSPSSAGAGSFTITYTYTNFNSCKNYASKNISVLNIPDVQLNMDSIVCFNNPSFLLDNGTPAGGNYFVDGISATEFDPALLGIGIHKVVYSYFDEECSNSDTANVLVDVCTSSGKILNTSFAKIFPNPADDYVTISCEKCADLKYITISNELGKEMKTILTNGSLSKIVIDIREWSSGIYWVVLHNNAIDKTMMLVVQ